MIIPVDELDDALATQRLDSQAFQGVGRESLRVVGQEVRRDFMRTSPHETTEWTSSRGLVLVPHVSLELLNSCIVFAAPRTAIPRLFASFTNFSRSFWGIMDG
jgi:hypothetical protein